ncbi:helix-turn-helix domain-containing protein [Peribacillus kribbensis]|uniref:helix-turn-helix domain-containing protein n=1 Tax=Peribacillus kribbensis TaxID=356658 RepID=UPI0004014BE8|nr:helix-turn-helix domain-containing protein [Peribacillus kribbensis]
MNGNISLTIIINENIITNDNDYTKRIVVMFLKGESKADLMLHPVRFRIVQCLLGGKEKTVQEISTDLSDIPQATLYRHINKLLEGGLVMVVEQRQVRGTLEKVLALQSPAAVSREDLGRMSRDEHMHMFMMFVSSLVDDYDRYLHQEEFDLVKDGVSYRKATLYLSDQEFTEMVTAIRQAIESALPNTPSESRRKRIISNIVMPDGN